MGHGGGGNALAGRWTTVLVTVAAAVLAVVPRASAEAGTGASSTFQGTTSQLTPMSFTVDHDPGTRAIYVNRTTFEPDLDCPSEQLYVYSVTFTSGARIHDGRFVADNLFPAQHDR